MPLRRLMHRFSCFYELSNEVPKAAFSEPLIKQFRYQLHRVQFVVKVIVFWPEHLSSRRLNLSHSQSLFKSQRAAHCNDSIPSRWNKCFGGVTVRGSSFVSGMRDLLETEGDPVDAGTRDSVPNKSGGLQLL